MCVCDKDDLKREGALTDSVRAANERCGLAEMTQSAPETVLDRANAK